MTTDKLLDPITEGHLIRSCHKAVGKFFEFVLDCYWRLIRKIDVSISHVAIRLVSARTEIVPNRVFFMTTRGDYQCNPKWICEELLSRESGCEAYWCVRKKTDIASSRFPKGLKLVERGSAAFYRALASSRVIVDNSINVIYLGYRPKPGQTYVETWHGAIGIKRFSADSVTERKWRNDAFLSARYIGYLISNSSMEDEIYREDYWKENEILRHGHARNDILFLPPESPRAAEIRARIYRDYGISPGTRICLYAPTFRENVDKNEAARQVGMIDFMRVKRALERRFGGEWVVMVRLHFKTMKQLKSSGRFGNSAVVDAGDYPDIQELLTCTDVGITDYSSWICEYLLTHRPGFLFAPDYEQFTENERGLYYPLESMPYPLALDNDMLEKNILDFREEGFPERCDRFLRDKGCVDDGHAAARTVDKILDLLKPE